MWRGCQYFDRYWPDLMKISDSRFRRDLRFLFFICKIEHSQCVVCSLCSVFVGFKWRQAYCQEPTITMATTVKTFLVWLHTYIPGSQGLDYTVLTLNFMDSFILMQLSLATSILIGFFVSAWAVFHRFSPPVIVEENLSG